MQGCSDVISVFCSLYISQQRLTVMFVLFRNLDVPALVFFVFPLPSGSLVLCRLADSTSRQRQTRGGRIYRFTYSFVLWPPAKCHLQAVWLRPAFTLFMPPPLLVKTLLWLDRKKPRGKGESTPACEYRLTVKSQQETPSVRCLSCRLNPAVVLSTW